MCKYVQLVWDFLQIFNCAVKNGFEQRNGVLDFSIMMLPNDRQRQQLILAVDVGTLSVRVAAYDFAGNMAVFADRKIGLVHVTETKIEQDPIKLRTALFDTMDRVMATPVVRERGIAAAGLASQRSSVVAWNRVTGQPLSPVLSWQDRRATEYLKPLANKGVGIKARSGLFLSPHYGASKLRWLLDNCPELTSAREAGELVLGPLAAFMVFNLLEGQPCIVDHVNASRTQLMSLMEREWSRDLLQEFGLSQELLPQCRPTQSFFGHVRGTGIPVTAVNGDQNAAIHATGKLEVDTLIVNIGTGAFVLLPTGHQIIHHPSLITSIANSTENEATYLLEGTVNGAGAALKWAAEQWGEPDLISQLPEWLKQIKDPPVFINTIGGVGSPFWISDLKPYFLTDGSVAEKTVAIIESIIFLIKINLEAMTNTGQRVKRIRISGGLSALDGLCQLLADATQRVVLRPEVKEATSQGIAWLAANLDYNWHNSTEDSDQDYFLPQNNRPLQARYRLFCSELGWR